jgi:hypothetical protein
MRGAVWQPLHVTYSAGAQRSAVRTLEMIPVILMVDHPAPLPWLLSSATAGSVHPCQPRR